MIYIDNFLSEGVLNETLLDIKNTGFKDLEYGDKVFNSYMPSETLKSLIWEKLSVIHKQQVDPIFAFARKATDKIDTNWNIHSDAHVLDVLPTHAAVLCLAPKPKGVINGTAFWTHEKYGSNFTAPMSEFDEQRKDENDLSKFELDKVIGYKQNRVIIYESNRYHSAYPNTAWPEGRVVMACFYRVL